jgi:hypothetical protein
MTLKCPNIRMFAMNIQTAAGKASLGQAKVQLLQTYRVKDRNKRHGTESLRSRMSLRKK